MKTRPYRYLLRPGYGSAEFLLEFDLAPDTWKLLEVIVRLLEENGFTKENKAFDMPGLSFRIGFCSANGNILLEKDDWDLVFITAEQNQTDIFKVSDLLQASGLFEKGDTDFSKYQ